MSVATAADYSAVSNGRFKGGFITRNYGQPEENVHAVQLELSQRCYMDENELSYDAGAAVKVGKTIKAMLTAFIEAALD